MTIFNDHGFGGTGTAGYVHYRFNKQPKDKINSWDERLKERLPIAVRGVVAEGIRNSVSIWLSWKPGPDTHNLATPRRFMVLNTVAQRAGDVIERIGELLNKPEAGVRLADRLKREAKFISLAATAGYGSHVMTDISTGRHNEALQLLYPLSTITFDWGLLAVSPELQSFVLAAGVLVAIGAWGTVATRVIFPDAVWHSIVAWAMSTVDRAREAVNRIKGKMAVLTNKVANTAMSLASVVRRTGGRVRESVTETVEEGGEKLEEAAEGIQEKGKTIKDKAEETVETGKKKVEETVEKAKTEVKETAQEGREKLEETAKEIQEKGKAIKNKAEEVVKKGKKKVEETAQKAKKKAKETAQKAKKKSKKVVNKAKSVIGGLL